MRWLRTVVLGLGLLCPLILPVMSWSVPLLAPLLAWHPRQWWTDHTPLCAGVVCLNAWPDHIDIDLSFRIQG